MKIILINPPFSAYGGLKGHGGKSLPLNLGYLAAYVRRERSDYKLSIFDAEALCMSFEDIVKHISAENPDVIGITSSTPGFSNAIKTAQVCKGANSRAWVVLGGIHPSAFPEETVKEESVDFVVAGEGEITFLELLAALEKKEGFSGIKGLVFKENGRVVRNEPRPLIEDLDSLPFPARGLMPLNLYQPPPTKRVSIFKPTYLTTARGCPFNCTYCSAKVVWQRRYRFRSPENVVNEIEHCIRDFDIREFNFTDELFTANHARVKAFCEEIIKRNLKIAWVCMSRAGGVSLEILKLMKKSGCKEISFGLESGDEAVLKKIKKEATIESAFKSIMLVKKSGIKTHASYMLGNIGETPQTIRKTINLAKKLNTDIAAFFIASPLPGTEFYEEALRLGYLRKNFEWRDFSPLSKGLPVINLPNLSSEELLRWHKRAIREYYIRPRYILKRLFGLRHKIDFLNAYEGMKLFFRIIMRGKS